MAKKKLYHTSPEEIEDIHDQGTYGSQLFFSDKPYYMTQHDDPKLYEIEADENEFLDVNTLPYVEAEDYEKIKPIIKKIKDLTGLDDDEAMDMLSERSSLWEFTNGLEDYVNFYSENEKNEEEKDRKFKLYEKLKSKDIGELDWLIQKFSGMAAKALGYKGAKLFDEQGVSYLIDMLGRHKDLKLSDQ